MHHSAPSSRSLRTRHHIFLAGLLWATSAQCGASILLDRIIVEFPHTEAPRQDLYVINEAKENAYVKVEVLAVNNPGEAHEERVSLAGAEDLPFIASPARLVIGPLGRKQIRLVNLNGATDTEQVYRVNVTPVLPPLTGDEGAMVRVVVAYQALVIAHPSQPREKLGVARNGNSATFTNQGNTYVFLSDGQQCDEQGKRCVDLPSRRLYAGNEWQLDLPFTTPARYTVTTHKGARQDSF